MLQLFSYQSWSQSKVLIPYGPKGPQKGSLIIRKVKVSCNAVKGVLTERKQNKIIKQNFIQKILLKK